MSHLIFLPLKLNSISFIKVGFALLQWILPELLFFWPRVFLDRQGSRTHSEVSPVQIQILNSSDGTRVDHALLFALHPVSLLPSADGSTTGMRSESMNSSPASLSPTPSSFLLSFSLFPSLLAAVFAVLAPVEPPPAPGTMVAASERSSLSTSKPSVGVGVRTSLSPPSAASLPESSKSRENEEDLKKKRKKHEVEMFLQNDLHDFSRSWIIAWRVDRDRTLEHVWRK